MQLRGRADNLRKRAAKEKGPLPAQRPFLLQLVVLLADFFPGTLLRQSLLYAPSLAWLQIVGVTFHFLNDVFGLNLTLEPTESVLERLALLQSNLGHANHPPTSPYRTNYSLSFAPPQPK